MSLRCNVSKANKKDNCRSKFRRSNKKRSYKKDINKFKDNKGQRLRRSLFNWMKKEKNKLRSK